MIVSYSDISIALGAVALAALSGSSFHKSCDSFDVVQSSLSTQGQSLTASGWTASNEAVNLFVASDSGKWTVTLTTVNGVTCPVARGANYESAEIDGYLMPVNGQSN